MGFGPVTKVENGKLVLQHISATQGNNYLSCQQRWYSEVIERVPLFYDWDYSEDGVAIHEILEKEIGLKIGKIFDESKRRIFNPKAIHDAQKLVNQFNWSQYFKNHQIIDTEVDLTLNLQNLNNISNVENDTNESLPLFVLSLDVLSKNNKGVTTITEWKSGFSDEKGLDIQLQGNVLGVMQNMNLKEVIYRRIYIRIKDEKNGLAMIEEYKFNQADATSYALMLKQIALKMKKTSEGVRSPKVTVSANCVHCPVSGSCSKVKDTNFNPRVLTQKLKVLNASVRNTKNALIKVAEKGGNFYVDKELYGVIQNKSYYPSKEINNDEVLKLLIKENLNLLLGTRVTITPEIKKFLESKGYGGFNKNKQKIFKFLNERELRDKSRACKKAQKTIAMGEISSKAV